MIVAGESKTLRINTKYDLSGASTLKMVVHHPDGQRATIINPRLTVGAVDVVDGKITLNANEYIMLKTDVNDFPIADDYRLQISATDNTGLEIASLVKLLTVQKRLAE